MDISYSPIPLDKYNSMTRFITELHMPKELSKIRKEGGAYYISDILEKYGFERIGSGWHANVYENPKYPYILKVFYEDSAYLDWLKFCMKNQNNKYIPKLRKNFIRVMPDKNIYAVRMEKLYECDEDDFNSFMVSLESWNAPGIDEDLKTIIHYLRNTQHEVDLHDENVMQRSNGQVVVTDPIS